MKGSEAWVRAALAASRKRSTILNSLGARRRNCIVEQIINEEAVLTKVTPGPITRLGQTAKESGVTGGGSGHSDGSGLDPHGLVPATPSSTCAPGYSNVESKRSTPCIPHTTP